MAVSQFVTECTQSPVSISQNPEPGAERLLTLVVGGIHNKVADSTGVGGIFVQYSQNSITQLSFF